MTTTYQLAELGKGSLIASVLSMMYPSHDPSDGASLSSFSLKRKRGVLLSLQGWQRIQSAEAAIALQSNDGKPLTLEQLSDRSGLSTKTLTKVRQRQKPVDVITLQTYFQSIHLTLEAEDYLAEIENEPRTPSPLPQTWLTGPLPIESPFYIFRPPAETTVFREIMQPGALVRIKAPRQFGKTSLVTKAIFHATEQEFRTAILSLQLADSHVLSELEKFLQWFCASLSRCLGVPNRLDTFWNPLFGSSYSCDDYFENYLLATSDAPLLIILDEINVLFQYPEVATDFFALVRAWYERSRHRSGQNQAWQKLRLILIYSTDIFFSLNVHQSPFNVGVMIHLPEFTLSQVQTLVILYRVTEAETCALKLFQLLGGHPFLTQLALFHLGTGKLCLEELLCTAIAPNSIFQSHFNQQLYYLESDGELKEAMRQIVSTPQGLELYPTIANKLRGVGLIRFQGQLSVPFCQLYQRFLEKVFNCWG
ncbi:AAA-like domain-containing protein [Alkalinema pantanalense CENA528]|uniref:AAA-like domain-containing protein n=1 Tax=Alkalinema pantanalense TaxID=1620705 RepID=UPI003D6F6D03